MPFIYAPTLPEQKEIYKPATRKSVGRAQFMGGNRPIEIVCDRLLRDFERGTSLRSVAKMYELRVEGLEGVLRDRLRALEAGMRRAGINISNEEAA